MLSQCANSRCGRVFLRLGEGKLFLVETEYADTGGDLTAPPSSHMRKAPPARAALLVMRSVRRGLDIGAELE